MLWDARKQAVVSSGVRQHRPPKEVPFDEGLEGGDIWGKSVSGQSTARAKALRPSSWRTREEGKRNNTLDKD